MDLRSSALGFTAMRGGYRGVSPRAVNRNVTRSPGELRGPFGTIAPSPRRAFRGRRAPRTRGGRADDDPGADGSRPTGALRPPAAPVDGPDPAEERLAPLRGARVDVDTRRAAQAVVAVCLVALAVLAVVLFVAGRRRTPSSRVPGGPRGARRRAGHRLPGRDGGQRLQRRRLRLHGDLHGLRCPLHRGDPGARCRPSGPRSGGSPSPGTPPVVHPGHGGGPAGLLDVFIAPLVLFFLVLLMPWCSSAASIDAGDPRAR